MAAKLNDKMGIDNLKLHLPQPDTKQIEERNKITTWGRGYFVDQPQYVHWTMQQKQQANVNEIHNVRGPEPTDNAICRCEDPHMAAWIAARLNLCAKLEAKINELRPKVEHLV